MTHRTSPFSRAIVRLNLLALVALAALVAASAQPARAAGLTCNNVPATITGFGKIVGTEGNDVIVGSPIGDTIDGRGGDDRICGIADGRESIDEGDNI